MKKFTILSALAASAILLAPAALQARDHYHPSRERESHGRYEGSRSGCNSGRDYGNPGRGYDYRGGYEPRYESHHEGYNPGRGYDRGPGRSGCNQGQGGHPGDFRGPFGLPGFLQGIFGGQRNCR